MNRIREIRGQELLDKYRENKEGVKKVFSEEKNVVLAYIFGSAAKGKITPLSDLDFAVYLDEELSKGGRFDLRLKLLIKLNCILGDAVNLVPINSADLLMKFNIVKTGEVIFQRTEAEKIEFESRIMDFYMDMKPYQDRHVEKTLKKISEEGLVLNQR